MWNIRDIRGQRKINTLSYLGWGIAHERRGLPCQDFIGHSNTGNGNYIMALSDGASSAGFAGEAAAATVNGLIQYFEEHTLEEVLADEEETRKEKILAHVLECLISLGKKKGCTDPREFSATLLFIVSDGKNMVCGHIGDGAIYITDRNHEILFVSGPENAQGYSNRTFFTVSPNAIEHFRMHTVDMQETHASQVLMTSDGACLMFYNRGNHHPSRTAEEILRYVSEGIISTDEDLKDLLNQMAEVPSERLDDWSVLIGNLNEMPIHTGTLTHPEHVPEDTPSHPEHSPENMPFNPEHATADKPSYPGRTQADTPFRPVSMLAEEMQKISAGENRDED